MTDTKPASTHPFGQPPAPAPSSFLHHIWASIAATVILMIICCAIYPAIVWGIGQLIFPHQANGSLIKKDGSPTTDGAQPVGSELIAQNFTAPIYFHPRISEAGSGYDATASGASNLGPLSDKLINGLTSPATTQPTAQPESLSFDGIRLRTIHYASDNGLGFHLYLQRADGTGSKTEIPIKKYEDAQGNIQDVALVDAFPHPYTDTPDRMVLIAADFTDSHGNPVLIPGDAVTASASGLDPHISPANAQLQAVRVAGQRKMPLEKVQSLIDQYTDRPSLGIFGDPGVNVLKLNIALDQQK